MLGRNQNNWSLYMAASGKNTAIAEAKKVSKLKAHYTCEKCGKMDGVMHGAHIMPVTYAGTCADPYNILCLCAGCHSMGPHCAHQNPHEFVRWFEEMFPGRYDDLRERAYSYSKNPMPKKDWKAITKELRQMQKDLE